MIYSELHGGYLSHEDLQLMTSSAEADPKNEEDTEEFETVAELEKMQARLQEAAGLDQY